MEVEESYDLPFESEFEWQVSLFHILKELAVEAAIQIANEQKINPDLFEWKDEAGITNFIIDEDLLEKMKLSIKEKAFSRYLD